MVERSVGPYYITAGAFKEGTWIAIYDPVDGQTSIMKRGPVVSIQHKNLWVRAENGGMEVRTQIAYNGRRIE